MEMRQTKGAVSPVTKETRRESHAKTNKQTMHNEIFKLLEAEGGLTAREVAIHLHAAHRIEYPARAVVQPRLTELVELGWAKVCGKKYDPDTERRVAIYEAVLHD